MLFLPHPACSHISFLEWRRGLAVLQEEHGLLLTPFERNLELWRQLWRVIERRYAISYGKRGGDFVGKKRFRENFKFECVRYYRK